MSKRTGNESVSPDTEKKKRRLETTNEGSSAHTESEHLFNDTESGDASTEGKLDNPSVDNDMAPLSPDSMQLDEAPRGDDFLFEDEEYLHEQYDTCQYNPGHLNSFPVDYFSLDNLPPCYRKDEVMAFIKTVSALTVRVSVRDVNDDIQETVRGTDIPSLCFYDRSGNQMRVGSGIITKADLFPNGTCPCTECRNSHTQHEGFARVFIDTAARVVRGHQEARRTTCHLFFDSGKTPSTCKTEALTPMCGMWSDQERDTCVLVYITHDLDLAHELCNLIKDYGVYRQRLKYSDLFNMPENMDQSGRNNSTLKQPLDIMVSHPHGLAKQVSLGYCGSHGNAAIEEHQCVSNLTICPGSNGAPVITLGWK